MAFVASATGHTGHTGRAVVRVLRDRGVTAIALALQPARGGVQVVDGVDLDTVMREV